MANVMIKIGPRILWKLEASWKLSVVFPNQICTINQTMLFSFHLFLAIWHQKAVSHICGVLRKSIAELPRVHNVKSIPEKQTEAIPMKKMKSAIIPRSALDS